MNGHGFSRAYIDRTDHPPDEARNSRKFFMIRVHQFIRGSIFLFRITAGHNTTPGLKLATIPANAFSRWRR